MYKIIKISIIFLLIQQILFAYEAGNSLEKATIKQLNLNPNKLTVIDFFASWCVSCEKELPLIQKLHKKNLPNLEFIGIDTDEKLEAANKFQKKLGLTMKIINDNNQKIVSKFNPIGMPALYFIKNNKVEKVIFGAVDNLDKVILDNYKEIK